MLLISKIKRANPRCRRRGGPGDELNYAGQISKMYTQWHIHVYSSSATYVVYAMITCTYIVVHVDYHSPLWKTTHYSPSRRRRRREGEGGTRQVGQAGGKLQGQDWTSRRHGRGSALGWIPGRTGPGDAGPAPHLGRSERPLCDHDDEK